MQKITLANGVTFECAPDQTILDSARLNNIAIEYSCRTGRCGVCEAPLLSGQTVLLNEEEFLSDGSSDSTAILTCCRGPITDLVLGIEDLGEIGQVKTFTLPCRIESISFPNKDVIELTLRLPPNADFNFIPGQYIDLIGENGVRRSYSIANAPRKDRKISIHVKRVKNGVMSDYLFNRAKDNDLLRLEGPLGTFSFREDDSENIVLVATGTGIAPVKAILEGIQEGSLRRNLVVIWGGRYLKDLYWNPSCISLPHQYVPVLSREKSWDGAKGYVQHALLSLGLDLSSTTVYACGSESMIKDTLNLLLENGLPKNRFHSDAFISSK